MRITVKRSDKSWMVYEIRPTVAGKICRRVQFFDTWNEAITEALHRSEQIKTQCKQS